jgi:hypothetical protein
MSIHATRQQTEQLTHLQDRSQKGDLLGKKVLTTKNQTNAKWCILAMSIGSLTIIASIGALAFGLLPSHILSALPQCFQPLTSHIWVLYPTASVGMLIGGGLIGIGAYKIHRMKKNEIEAAAEPSEESKQMSDGAPNTSTISLAELSLITQITDAVPKNMKKLFERTVSTSYFTAFKTAIEKIMQNKEQYTDISPFYTVAINGTKEMAEYLFNNYKFEETVAKPSLNTAILHGNLQVVPTFIEGGASVSAQDRNGDTPLHYAVAQNVETIQMLLDKGADMSSKNGKGQTPIECFLQLIDLSQNNPNFVIEKHQKTGEYLSTTYPQYAEEIKKRFPQIKTT